jgi:hypothetical protein
MKKTSIFFTLVFTGIVGTVLAIKSPPKMALSSSTNPVIPISWTIPNWYIDPISGSDNNSCTTSGQPCQTYGSIVQRWGTDSPKLGQVTTITWLNDAPYTDPVILKAGLISPNGAISLLGTPTMISSGTFTTVTPKSLSSKQLLNANLGQSPTSFVGMMLFDVTRSGWCWIDSIVSGNIVALSQPLAQAFTPPNSGWTLFPSMVDTFGNGDSYQIWRPTQVKISDYRPVYYATAVNAGRVNMANIWTLDTENTGLNIGQTYFNTGIGVFTQSRFDTNLIPLVIQPSDSGALTNVFGFGGLNQTNDGGGLGIIGGSYGGRGITGIILTEVDIDAFTIFHSSVSVFISANFGTAYFDGNLVAFQQASVIQVNETFYSTYGLISVNAPLTLSPGAIISYLAPATTAFILPTSNPIELAGPNFIGGPTTGSAYDTTVDPSVWHAGRALTPTLFDTLIGSGGFKLSSGKSAAIYPALGNSISSL